MSELFVELIDLNEGIDYQTFVMMFCSYLFLLWLVISTWVGVDAYRRFGNTPIAIAFFLLTFVLNFPILIFYFIVRPDMKFEDYQEWESQGVSVPLVNFKGEKGVEMVLELKIQPPRMVEAQRDMKIDVSWESSNKDMELVATKTEPVLPGVPDKRGDQQVVNVFSKFGWIVRKRITRFKEVTVDYMHRAKKNKKAGELAYEMPEQDANSQNKKLQKNQSSKKKKKKKGKKR